MDENEKDGDSATSRRITFVVPQRDLDRLEEIAKVKRTRVSAVVREMIGAALDEMDTERQDERLHV